MKPWQEYVAAGFFLVLFVVLSVTSTLGKSATVEEFAHIPAGLYAWKTYDFSLHPEVPPTGRMVSTIVARFTSPQIDKVLDRFPDDGLRPWTYATEFMRQNQASYEKILLISRITMIFIGLLLCVVVWRSAREGYQEWGGLVALAACALSPTLIAHTRLVTPDVLAALFSLVFIIAMMMYFDGPRFFSAVGMAVALGIAVLTRFDCLFWTPFLVAAPVLAVVTDFTESVDKPSWPKAVFHVLLGIVVTWAVICGGYMFKGVDIHPDLQFGSEIFKTLAPLINYLPLPLDFIQGLDKLLYNPGMAEWSYGNYLLAEWYEGVKPQFYAVVLGTKVPLTHLLLFLYSAVLVVIGRPRDRDEIILLAACILFFVAVTFISPNQTGVRRLLPLFPLAFILMAKPAHDLFRVKPEWPKGFEGKTLQKKKWKVILNYAGKAVLGLFVTAMVVQQFFIWPDYLAYFNQPSKYIAAEPHRILIDSNLDWGQDLPGLSKWMKQNDVNGVDLAYYGHDDPARHGINYTLPARESDNYYIAISASFLMGKKYPMTFLTMPVKTDDPLWAEAGRYRNLAPVAAIGKSIFIYEIGAPDEQYEESGEENSELYDDEAGP